MPNQVFEASQQFYNSPRTVSAYSSLTILQPPELAIFTLLWPALASMNMLDLGVGAGRTTTHFAPLARYYTGSDFSPVMIEECRRKFPHLKFIVADASNLAVFADAAFDFILFSFNGLDCMLAEGRGKSLAEMQRILRPGGYLAFSSHNLQFIPTLRSLLTAMWPIHPKSLLRAAKRLLKFALRTRSVTYANDRATAIVRERHLGFDVPMFFTRPDRQIEVLRQLGWQDIRVFPCESGQETGQETADASALADIGDPWVYYLCRKAPVG